MKKVLFIDRDGTLIKEPPDEQIDAFEKLEFYPGVFTSLNKIAAELDFVITMVTNQDGLGTDSFPEKIFWPVQNFIITAFKNEGVEFFAIHIDKTFPHENANTRKPKTGMLTEYLSGNYDIENSFVIGDRLTDIILAKNLGCKAIMIENKYNHEDVVNEGLESYCSLITRDWEEIYIFLALPQRVFHIKRTTKETDIEISLNIDGTGKAEISTGIGFFDHMLDQITRHSGCDLFIKVKGDLHVDEHHTIEDTALALGEAFSMALVNKKGMNRYGFCLPMDDSIAQVAIDFGGRNWLVWNCEFNREKIGEFPTELFFHFFKSFSDTAKCNINIKAEGENEHHKIEAVFKAFAKAIKMAVKRNAGETILPSTKEII